MPEPATGRRPSIRTNGSKTLSQSSTRDARAVVGDVDLDLVAEPPDADADARPDRRVLRLVLEELLEDLPEARLVADRDDRAVRALPADRVRPEQEPQRLDGLVDRRDRVERRARQARSGPRRGPTRGSSRPGGRAATAGRWRRRANLAVAGGGSPVGPARRRRAGRRRPGRRTAASAARGSRPTAARPGRRRARSAGRAAPRSRPEPALLDDPGEQRGDRLEELDLVVVERADGARLDVEHADDRSCQTSGTDSIPASALDVEAADPGEPRRRA